jgi:hypothetical protein
MNIPAAFPLPMPISSAWDLVSKKRDRMTKDTIHELRCLKDWGVFGDLDDAEDDDDEDSEEASSTVATNSTRGPRQ